MAVPYSITVEKCLLFLVPLKDFARSVTCKPLGLYTTYGRNKLCCRVKTSLGKYETLAPAYSRLQPTTMPSGQALPALVAEPVGVALADSTAGATSGASSGEDGYESSSVRVPRVDGLIFHGDVRKSKHSWAEKRPVRDTFNNRRRHLRIPAFGRRSRTRTLLGASTKTSIQSSRSS